MISIEWRQDMLDKVLELIKKKNLVQAGETVIAGVSGGADSICLLSVLYELREQLDIGLAAVHVNHGIRGAEADRDEAFVRSFCRERDIPCLVYHKDVPRLAEEDHLTEEEAGRLVRLSCFREAMVRTGVGTVAVAHNRNDNAETVLFHLFRGTGLKGLAGMEAKTAFPGASAEDCFLIRPLLDCPRQEIEDYLAERGIGFCTDSTNQSEEYSRNRIRLNILPQAELVNEEAVLHIVQTARMAGALDREEQAAAEGWLKRHGDIKKISGGRAEELRIPAAELAARGEFRAGYVLRLALEKLTGSLKDITKRHTDSIFALTEKQTGRKVQLPGGLTAEREYGEIALQIEKKQETGCRAETRQTATMGDGGRTSGDQNSLPETKPEQQGQTRVITDQARQKATIRDNNKWPEEAGDNGRPARPTAGEQILAPDLSVRTAELFGYSFTYRLLPYCAGQKIPENRYTKWFDYDKIKNSLSLRGRRPGDWFEAFAGGGKQTVKAYMVNEKIPSKKRGGIPLLADESHVLWIVGGRISEGYKVTEETTRVLEVSVLPDKKVKE